MRCVCEVFSPPRMCAIAKVKGLRGGWPVDIASRDPVTGRIFDLRKPKDQKEVKRMIRRYCPTELVVSPPCTAFSIANQGEVDPATLAGATEMIRFSMEVCDMQHRPGRHFVFEQPQSSLAWHIDEVVQMAYRDHVFKTSFHQWMYGLEASDHLGTAPAYKPTSVLSNHPALAEVLQERCSGGHRHVQLVGRRACSHAAIYPRGLCNAVLKGVDIIKKELEERVLELRKMESVNECDFPVHPEDCLFELEMEDMCEQGPSTWESIANQRWQEHPNASGARVPAAPGETLDSTTGELLDPRKVQEGCEEEMKFTSQMHVWDKVTRVSAQNDPEG